MFLVGGSIWAIYTYDYLSSPAPATGIYGPPYVVAFFGTHFLAILCGGILMAVFVATGRDRRALMAEVLETRPVSNLSLAVGRTLGVTLVIWLPALCFGLSLQVAGAMAEKFDWPVGGAVESVSLSTILVFSLPPWLLLWSALADCAAKVARNRVLALVACLGLLGLWFQLVPSSPSGLPDTTALFANHGVIRVSTLLPTIGGLEFALGRVSCLALAAALLCVGAGASARRDNSSAGHRANVVAALLLSAMGLASAASLATAEQRAIDERARWIEVHGSMRRMDSYDLTSLSGDIVLAPSDEMHIAVELKLTPANSASELPEAFTLNPGLRVSAVRVEGQTTPFRHESGLLSLDIPERHRGRPFVLLVRASGQPHPDFGHLTEVAPPPQRLPSGQPRRGNKVAVFRSGYVALMPDAHWLPSLGPALSSVGQERQRDFHRLALSVDVPAGWTVAGPGVRTALAAESGRSRFLFEPAVPVASVGLFASDFARRSMRVAGVEMELLLGRRQARNVDHFADATDEVRAMLATHISEAKRYGLEYPFDAFRLVEVPVDLRLYGGGWRLDSASSLPSMHLMPETGFPTVPVEKVLASLETSDDTARDKAGAAKAAALRKYLQRDNTVQSPLGGFHRNLLSQHMALSGEGSVAVHFILEALVRLVFLHEPDVYSEWFMTADTLKTVGSVALAALERVGIGIPPRLDAFDAVVSSSMARRPLTELGVAPAEDSVLLHLRGSAIARSIYDALGLEGTAKLLAEIGRYKYDDAFDVGKFEDIAMDHIGQRFHSMTSGWLHEGGRPGFTIRQPRVRRLAKPDDRGITRHVVLVDIHNEEPVAGSLRVAYADGVGLAYTDVITIEGHSSTTVGLETKLPLSWGWVEPYFALNDTKVTLEEVQADLGAPPADESMVGLTASVWTPRRSSTGIVVDDLDDGFSVSHAPPDAALNLLGAGRRPRSSPRDAFGSDPATGDWQRKSLSSAWGSAYRRTVTDIRAGSGRSKARFQAVLPASGSWQLAYHMPDLMSASLSRTSLTHGRREDHGDYTLVVEGANHAYTVVFDAASSVRGWNVLGRFELPAGPVSVFVTDSTTGNVVYADAVRWLPAKSTGDAGHGGNNSDDTKKG